MTQPDYCLELSHAQQATWLIPHVQSSGTTWQTSLWTGPELNQVVYHLAHQLEAAFTGTALARYCIVASDDPLSVLLCCLAAWRSCAVVVLPNNLRPLTLKQLENSDFEPDSPAPRPHPRLSDAQVELAYRSIVAGAVQGPPQRSTISHAECAAICYTSGSSGAPQANRKLVRQLFGEAQLQAAQFMGAIDGTVACSVPAYHLYGLLFSCLVPWLAGLPLLGALGQSSGAAVVPPALRQLVTLGRAEVLVSVPAHLHALLATDPTLLSSMRQVFSSAAPLPSAVGSGILALKPAPRLVEVWGSTETGGVATRTNDPGGVWLPLPGVSIKTNGDQQLVLNSPFTASGSSETYVTADQVDLKDDGFVHLGRSDGVLKVGGKRISLQALERCALDHPQVLDVACLALPARGIRNEMVVMAVQRSEPSFTRHELQKHLASHFDEVVLPRQIRFLDRLPRTPTGKIQRDALLTLFSSGHMSQKPPLPENRLRSSLQQAGFVEVSLISAEAPEQLCFELKTEPSQLWFQGHFKGAPILPGVVQLRSLVLKSTQIVWPELFALTGITKVKFKRPIIPGDHLRVTLTRNSARSSVNFSIQWLGNDKRHNSPLALLLPQVFAVPAPSEASSGTLLFSAPS